MVQLFGQLNTNWLSMVKQGADSPNDRNEVLPIGNSVVGFVELPQTITYSFPCFKVAVLIEQDTNEMIRAIGE